MGPLRDCECGMAKILHNVKQCSTCEVADRMADEIATLTRELYEALAECVDLIDTFYGPPGSNRIDRELIARARAALAKARGEEVRDA